MDVVSLKVQRPLYCKETCFSDKNLGKIKPFLGFFPTRRTNMFSQFIQSTSWRKDPTIVGVSHPIVASSDAPQKKQRKVWKMTQKDNAQKGITAKSSNQRKREVKSDEGQNDEAKIIGVEKENQKDLMEETLRKQDMEEFLRRKAMESSLRMLELEEHVLENLEKGVKMFTFPKVVRPNDSIEIFLNKKVSTLKDETNVFIMGAFNDWRYKPFTSTLKMTNIVRQLWSCQLHVPKEAYKIDFVFFNGEDIYENNEKKDFCVNVEGGISLFEFQEILLEEKMKEFEEIKEEKAQLLKRAEEKRRIEEEKAACEVDKAQARDEVKKRREILENHMKKALTFVENLWCIETKDKDMMRLYYNKSLSPLPNGNELWFHGGFNNWNEGSSIVEKLVKSEKENGDWWYVDVVIPDRALVLDWVFANGPPQQATIYDNNGQGDFHAIIPTTLTQDQYWLEEEQAIYNEIHTKRRSKEEEIRAKAEKTAIMKAETKERTMKKFLLSQKHVVYTDPINVKAGSFINLFYNPSNTVLNGKPEIWLKYSFNRWSHSVGLFPPQKMVPENDQVKTSVKIPLSAYMMDFVFSEKEGDDGVFDNRNGMDYHMPISGGVVKEPPMHIVHIAVEMAPIAKVGGLGDVITSLSRAVQDLSHNVDVILPKYDCLNHNHVKDFGYLRSYSWSGTEIKVWSGKVEGLNVYFLEPQNGFFWAGCVYGCKNDGERFGFFCHAALEFLVQSKYNPDVIHCHDWSSAPVAWLFKDHYMQNGLDKARVIFTIHNLEFGAHLIGKAMAYADKSTTVSPTYMQEIAGNPIIAPHLNKFHGILNGIDPDIWDPYNDEFIPVSYTSENVVEGKRAAKEALQQKLGLQRADVPLIGIITRLTHQKGINLIIHAIWRTLDRGGQVVLLGSAPDPRIQNDFVNLANQLHSSHNNRARLCLAYDEPLSHLIYAGSDFILVPSMFEPCGLTQLIAMRYGSVPIVRKTGGLHDTVFDVDDDKERAESRGHETNGFNFEVADAGGVDYAVNRAISAWYDDRDWFSSLCKQVMGQDWSWNRPALDYLELYHAARK